MIGAERQAYAESLDSLHEVQHAAQFLRSAWSLVRNDLMTTGHGDALEQTEE